MPWEAALEKEKKKKKKKFIYFVYTPQLKITQTKRLTFANGVKYKVYSTQKEVKICHIWFKNSKTFDSKMMPHLIQKKKKKKLKYATFDSKILGNYLRVDSLTC